MKTTPIDWERISTSSPAFLQAVKTDSLVQLMHEYFSKNSILNQKFVVELSYSYPDILLSSIRVNRAFLNHHAPTFDFLKTHQNAYLKDHCTVFTKLAEHEKALFTSFYESMKACSNQEILEVFCWISLWFEEKRASLFIAKNADILMYDIHPFIEAINFFLSYFLFENRSRINPIEFTEFADVLILAKVLSRAQSKPEGQPVWEALNNAFNYQYYLTGTIETYSYDSNYEAEIIGAYAELKFLDPGKIQKWGNENAKIRYWYAYYRDLAEEIVKKKIQQNPKYIVNKTGFDHEMNYEGAIRETLSNLIAEDFCINESVLGGVPSASLIKFLKGFVANAWGRFVSPMDKLNYRNPGDWLKNVHSNIIDFGKHEIASGPTRLIHKARLIDIANKNIEGSQNYSESLLALISMDVNDIRSINRFNVPINLTGKPFIKMGEWYISLNGILGETNSQTNILKSILESNFDHHRRVMAKEVEALERKVDLMFEAAGFKHCICTVDYHADNKTFGNFDIVVYESGVLLLIELKRSRVRIKLSDAYDEFINSTLKASGQLDRATDYILKNFDTCKNKYFKKLDIKENKASELKIYPLIVSTSFENDHTLIKNKHLKITLFELQNILLNEIECVSGNRLESLIMNILSNKYWTALEKEVDLPDLNMFTLRFKI